MVGARPTPSGRHSPSPGERPERPAGALAVWIARFLGAAGSYASPGVTSYRSLGHQVQPGPVWREKHETGPRGEHWTTQGYPSASTGCPRPTQRRPSSKSLGTKVDEEGCAPPPIPAGSSSQRNRAGKRDRWGMIGLVHGLISPARWTPVRWKAAETPQQSPRSRPAAAAPSGLNGSPQEPP